MVVPGWCSRLHAAKADAEGAASPGHKALSEEKGQAEAQVIGHYSKGHWTFPLPLSVFLATLAQS